jgi:hypothetical protein
MTTSWDVLGRRRAEADAGVPHDVHCGSQSCTIWPAEGDCERKRSSRE